jgi:hypothetical protein
MTYPLGSQVKTFLKRAPLHLKLFYIGLEDYKFWSNDTHFRNK